MINQISQASEAQSKFFDAVNEVFARIANVIFKTIATAKKFAAQSQMLRKLVAQFRLKEER